MSECWWGNHSLAEGECRHWRIGPFSMWLTRLAREYRLVTLRRDDPDARDLVAGEPWNDPAPEEGVVTRFGLPTGNTDLEILPRSADRAFIFKSSNPFIVPAGSSVSAFLSSPVWMSLHLRDPERLLHEEPTFRPSDTWFGPSTLEGELCYAARTSVRYTLANVPRRPYRALTVVKIINHAPSALPLARLRLPLPQLSLFADEDGRLWTEAVTLDRRHDGDFAEIQLGRNAPEEAGACMRVCKPRAPLGRHSLIRSFTGLLGLSGSREET